MKFSSNCTPTIICKLLFYKANACEEPYENQYKGVKYTRGSETKDVILSVNPYGLSELTKDGKT